MVLIQSTNLNLQNKDNPNIISDIESKYAEEALLFVITEDKQLISLDANLSELYFKLLSSSSSYQDVYNIIEEEIKNLNYNNIEGFASIFIYKNTAKSIVYGSASIKTKSGMVSNSIIDIDPSENALLYMNSNIIDIAIKKNKSIISQVNNFTKKFYSKYKLNSITTTTLVSIASISYIGSQSSHIKDNMDFMEGKRQFLEYKVDQLEAENSGLYEENRAWREISEEDQIINADQKYQDIENLKDLLREKEDNISKLENQLTDSFKELDKRKNQTINLEQKIDTLNGLIVNVDKSLKNSNIDASVYSSNFSSQLNHILSQMQSSSKESVSLDEITKKKDDQIKSLLAENEKVNKDLLTYKNKLDNIKSENSIKIDSSKEEKLIEENKQLKLAVQSLTSKNQTITTHLSMMKLQLKNIILKYIEETGSSDQLLNMDSIDKDSFLIKLVNDN